MDPWFLVAPGAFSSSLGIILVTQTNIIPYTSGYFSIREFAWAGILMTLVMIVVLSLTLLGMGALWGTYRI